MRNEEPIAAVLIHVSSVSEALSWYEQALPGAKRCEIGEPWNVEYLDVGGIMVEFAPADSKVGSGPAGSVVYWSVADFKGMLNRLVELGAKVYRGPIDIETGQAMAQVRDPWGNCIGIRGSSD